MAEYTTHLEQMYDKKTADRKRNYLNYNLGKIFSKVNPKKFSALEIGPGLGECVSYLNSLGITDIDISDNDKEILSGIKKRNKINKIILSSDITRNEKDLRSYDLIVMIQVLEHIPVDRYEAIIQLLYKHLNKNGNIVIVVPNANNPLGLVERYGDLQHTSSFTEQSLKDLVNYCRLSKAESKIKGFEIPPYDLINIVRIFLQKILHNLLLLLLIINGGIYFKVMTPNIMLIIKKTT